MKQKINKLKKTNEGIIITFKHKGYYVKTLELGKVKSITFLVDISNLDEIMSIEIIWNLILKTI